MRIVLAAFCLVTLAAMAGEPAVRTGETLVRETCALCRSKGIGGAPRIRSAGDWRPRLRAGLDGLVRSAEQGKGAMPPRGGVPDATHAELRSAISYMIGGAIEAAPSR